jgi:hypothetical protein
MQQQRVLLESCCDSCQPKRPSPHTGHDGRLGQATAIGSRPLIEEYIKRLRRGPQGGSRVGGEMVWHLAL